MLEPKFDLLHLLEAGQEEVDHLLGAVYLAGVGQGQKEVLDHHFSSGNNLLSLVQS